MDNAIAKNTAIAHHWFDAFNAHNLEALLALYADDAVHYSPKLKIRMPETEGLIAGKPALRTWWQDSFDRLPGLRYHPFNFIVNEHSVFMEYRRTVPGEADLLVGEVLEIHAGVIVKSRVYHG